MNEFLKNDLFINTILNQSNTGLAVVSYNPSLQDFVFLFGNQTFYKFNSFVTGKVDGRSLLDVFPQSRENEMYEFLLSVIQQENNQEKNLSYFHEDRGVVNQRIHAVFIGRSSVFCMFNDVTDYENMKNLALFEQKKFEKTINSIDTGIVTTRPTGEIELINNYALQMFHLKGENAVGQKIQDLLSIHPWSDEETINNIFIGLPIHRVESGNYKHTNVVIKITNLIDENGVKHGSVYTFEDMSDFVRAQEELIYINYHDIPTGFYNRGYMKLYMDKLETQAGYTVIAADINGLKRINSLYGMEKGDQMIVLCANAIKEAAPSKAICIRFGEDDFLMLIPPDIHNPHPSPSEIIQKITHLYAIRQKNIQIESSLSFGSGQVKGEIDTISLAVEMAQERMLYSKVLERKSIHSAALNSLLMALQVRSHETEEHAQRLYELSLIIASQLELSEMGGHHLSLLAILHDVGKIGVPDFVLNKPDKLTDDEWKIMMSHSDLGSRILEVTPELKEIAPLVRAHHERWDGSGYPDGLQGNDIPLLSRIIAVVDAYDAMTNDRVYRKAMPVYAALEEVANGMGTQFDPLLADIFIKGMIEEMNLDI